MSDKYMVFRNVKPKKQVVLLQVLRDSGYHGLCDEYETKYYLPFARKINIILRDNEVTWEDVHIKPGGVELDLDIELTIKHKRYTKDILKILDKQDVIWRLGCKPSEFNPSEFVTYPFKLYVEYNYLRFED